MSESHFVRKFLAPALIALLGLLALPGQPAASSDTIRSLGAAVRGQGAAGLLVTSIPSTVLVGGSFKITGSGFSSGSVVNFFVSNVKGAVNEGPLRPSRPIAPTSLTLEVPADIPLGQGVVALQVVNTDQGFAASNFVYALLAGSAAAGIPSLTTIDGVALAATSVDPSFAVDNVETVVTLSTGVTLEGSGFDTVNGVAVDVFCACAGGKVGPFLVNAGDPALTATSVTVALPPMGSNALPAGPASIVISNRGADGQYTKKSNAVSVPIGRSISVIGVSQEVTTLVVEGTGFSTLTVLNFFVAQHGKAVNLGGLTSLGTPVIPITLISDTQLAFEVPPGAGPGSAYVQALNPPFIPFSSSGNDSGGAFILLGARPTSTPTSTPSPTPTATPRFGTPTSTPRFTMRPSPTPTATAALEAEVLIAGGIDNTVTPSGSHPALASAEIYDEATGSFSPTGLMAYARIGHTVTALNNGTVLVAGGHNAFSLRPMPSAELYDIKNESFSFTGSMNSARLGHTAVLIRDGQVLVAGGWNVDFSAIDLTDAYDPATEQFTPTESLVDARIGHTATLLKDGTILVAGGADDSGLLSSAELCDPDGDTCNLVGTMAVARQSATATLLNNGQVLIAGGIADTASCAGCATATAELYDPIMATFTATGSMHAARVGYSATLLPDGKVLIAGGLDDQTNAVLDAAEIFDPAKGTFSVAAKMVLGRFYHTANALADGKVLIAGGFQDTSSITSTAELYDPLEGVFTPTGSMTDSRAEAAAAYIAVPPSEALPRNQPRYRNNGASAQGPSAQ